MSYTVRYGEDVPPDVPVRVSGIGAAGAALVLSVCIFSVVFGLSGLTEPVRNMLFPWRQEAVREAFSELRYELRQGSSFREAFGEFYVEIIADGMEPD